MNILVPYSWIKDFLKTDVEPEKVFRLTTACGPTIEGFERKGDDYILNIEVTINRPDCLSVLGIAREMYIILRQNNLVAKLENDYLSNPPKISLSNEKIPLKIKVNGKLCPRFTAVILSNIKIGPSPDFIKDRLEKAGMRSLNNVIDITNYVMLEMGQPDHAFDMAKIKGKKLIVREAKDGEKVLTLDGKERLLENGDIIYEDGEERIIDLSGIMGGGLSEIDTDTKTLFYTVVNYYFAQIRKTSMRLGIQTEASARFTKVMDQEIVFPSMLRAVDLFAKYAGAKVASEIVDLYPKPQKAEKIQLTDEFIEEKIGLFVPLKIIDTILKNLGFSLERSKNKLLVTPPIWRINDISLPEDVIEEVARIVNYDQIINLPLSFPLPEKNQNIYRRFLVENKIRHLLVGWGFTETISFSMLGKDDLKKAEALPENCIKISNPLTEEWEYMQPNLIINFLKNVAKNQSFTDEIKLFEIANVFDKEGKEKRSIIFGSNKASFLQIKGTFEQLINGLYLQSVKFLPNNKEFLLNESKSAQIMAEKEIGLIGEIKNQIALNFELKSLPVFAEIDLDSLLTLPKQVYNKVKRYLFTPIIEDISLQVPEKVTFEQILKIISETENIEKVELIDHFKNRFTFKIYFNLKEKQITEKESQKIREKILDKLEKELGVKLRTKS